MPDTNTPQVPDPQSGGCYVRNADGSLTQTHKTDEAQVVRAVDSSTATQAAGADTVAGANKE